MSKNRRMQIHAHLGGSISLMPSRTAGELVIKIACCTRKNHVNIETNGACREQQGKNEPFFSRIHCIGTLLVLAPS
jgi:hypothetical protein